MIIIWYNSYNMYNMLWSSYYMRAQSPTELGYAATSTDESRVRSPHGQDINIKVKTPDGYV